MLDYIPTVVQVIPYEDYTVDVYFDDGKIVCCHAERICHLAFLIG